MATYLSRTPAFSAATGAKTVLKIISPTSFAVVIHEFGLFTDGVTSSAVPATWDLFISDETGAGTSAGTAVTTQVNGATLAHGCTIGNNFTAEGSTYTVLKSGYLPQYNGALVLQNPLGYEEESPSGLADSIGLRINTTATVNVLAFIKWSRR